MIKTELTCCAVIDLTQEDNKYIYIYIYMTRTTMTRYVQCSQAVDMICTHQRTHHDLSSVSTDWFLTEVQFHLEDL